MGLGRKTKTDAISVSNEYIDLNKFIQSIYITIKTISGFLLFIFCFTKQLVVLEISSFAVNIIWQVTFLSILVPVNSSGASKLLHFSISAHVIPVKIAKPHKIKLNHNNSC